MPNNRASKYHSFQCGAKPIVWWLKRCLTTFLIMILFADPGFAREEVNIRQLSTLYYTWNICRGIEVQGDYAYLAAGPAGLRVIDISDPEKPFEVGNCVTAVSAVDIAIKDRIAYVMADTNGLKIISIEDPTSPVEISTFPTQGARALQLVDDIAYLDDNQGGFRVVDISNPAEPVSRGYYLPEQPLKRFTVQGKYSYVLTGSGSAMDIVDLSDPDNPHSVSRSSANGRFSQQLLADKSYLYSIHRQATIEPGDYLDLTVIDISEPLNPVRKASIWTGTANRIVKMNHCILLAQSYRCRLTMVNVTDPDCLAITGSFKSDMEQSAGSAYDIVVVGQTAYVATSYGLGIFDCSQALVVEQDNAYGVPESFGLVTYPNPFNPSTTISYSLPSAGQARLRLFSTDGREVRELMSGYQIAGSHTIRLDGSDLPAGVYLLRLEGANEAVTRKIVLIK